MKDEHRHQWRNLDTELVARLLEVEINKELESGEAQKRIETYL